MVVRRVDLNLSGTCVLSQSFLWILGAAFGTQWCWCRRSVACVRVRVYVAMWADGIVPVLPPFGFPHWGGKLVVYELGKVIRCGCFILSDCLS
jgi:hypothetical protein